MCGLCMKHFLTHSSTSLPVRMVVSTSVRRGQRHCAARVALNTARPSVHFQSISAYNNQACALQA